MEPKVNLTQDGKRRKKVKLPKYSKLNKKLIKAFDDFVETTPSARLSKNLRDLLLLYLSIEKDGLPNQFDEFITDFYFLMQLLDAVEDEIQER